MDAGGVADRIRVFEFCARTGSARIEDEDRRQHLLVLLAASAHDSRKYLFHQKVCRAA